MSSLISSSEMEPRDDLRFDIVVLLVAGRDELALQLAKRGYAGYGLEKCTFVHTGSWLVRLNWSTRALAS